MAAVSVAAEWQLLYNRYYRKPEIYSMQWKNKVDLSRNKVACAPFGGPIAVIRDDSKIVQLYAESALRKLRIFNCAGVQISEIVWKNPGGRLIGMAWTDDQILVCVTQDGTLYRYNIHAEVIESHVSMGQECFEHSVVECVFWGNGMVCINEANQLFCIPDFKNPNPIIMADPNLYELPLCMAVIEPQYTMSGNVEVLLAVEDHVLLVEEDGVQQLGVGVGPLQKMVVSRNGKLLASFTHDGRLLVMSTDFSKIIFEQSCESALPPQQLAWCGMDSVLLYWDDMLLMVGPYGDPVRYVYDESIILIPECDGVRILSNTTMEFLQRVPDSTVSIFKIGSTMPAALLYDALDHFDRRSAKADENLRLISSSLHEAVEACIDAAGHEFDVSRQRTLLRAASYGQAFSSHFQRDRFQDMSKTLRVLNAVHNHDIGIPLSIQQYKLLTPSVLVGRLVNAHQHFLALRISEYLGMNQDLVIMHWTCAKITASLAIPDASLLEILLDKLRIRKGMSYAAVAAYADKSGRRKLAAMLIEHEPRSSKQVPLLLSIGEEDTALTKATESGDTDLVYLVLFHIWHKRPALELFGTIQARPLARDLFISFARCCKHEFLKDFFLSTGQLQDVSFLLWKESWELAKNPMASKGSPLHGPRIKLIEKAQSLFAETREHTFESKAAEEHAKLLRRYEELKSEKQCRSFPINTKLPPFAKLLLPHGPHIKLIEKTQSLFAETREHTFESKAAEEHANLLRMQHELEVTTKQAIFVDSSISDTIRTCIVLGNHRAAMKVRTEFKVSEKRWYWLKVFALATIRDWDALENFSKEKRPPIGYRPFVEACVDADEKGEALKYIPKLTDPREKSEAYAQIGMAKEAADAASQAKDGELLGSLKLSFAHNTAASSIFDTLKDRLSFQGIS